MPALAPLLLSLAIVGCQPQLDVGRWSCEAQAEAQAQAIGGEAGAANDALVLPWSSSFEHEFCEYELQGFCYAASRADYEIVTSPVLTGRSAAAFRIDADGTMQGHQTRCVREGELPRAAFYSAHFLVPAAPTAADNWNLIHFRGREPGPLRGLWDVSLSVEEDGSLRVYVFDHQRDDIIPATGVAPVPVAEWFALEVYLARAADDTGEITVYQDGALAVQLTGLSTDDTTIGQWYVGNFATELTPSQSTIYVDDVAMREAP